jgi:hypothetical protein
MRFDEFLTHFPDAKKTGNGWTAKCPAHLDGSPSLSISEGSDGRTLLHCHAGCTPQAICTARGLTLADLFPTRPVNIAPPAKPRIDTNGESLDWQKCVADFTEGDAQKLAAARGLSIEFVRWLHAQGTVGIFEGKIAFANHGDGGAVVSAHVRRGGKPPWMFKPAGHKVAPLVFGDTKAAGFILAFESQWDAFAVMDKLGWHTANGLPDNAVFITRGAGNGKLIGGQIAPDAVCYAFKQNDAPTPEKPTPAGDIWLAEIASNAGCKVLNVATPAQHKDANDWTLAGASEAELRAAMKAAMPVQPKTAPVADSNRADIADEYLGREIEQQQTSLIERLTARIYSPQVKPPEPTPRFFLNGIEICTPGNLTTFFAQPKAGKTAAINAVIASTFAAPGADCFGFTSENPHGFAVVHFDTEQCQLDHWTGVGRLIRRAKVDAAPPWLLSYWLKGFTVEEIREAISLLLAAAKQKFGGIHSGIIDGTADAVNDVNDPAECNPFVARLEMLAVDFDCPILNVIHLNPGSTFKTRGHLGSHLERKSETNIQLEKDENEVTVIWSPNKNRRAPIPKNTAPRFAWSDEHQMHVSVQNIKGAKVDKEREDLTELARAIFSDRPAMRRFELETAVKIKLAVKDKTAERRVTAMLALGIVKKDLAGLYILTV